MLEARPAASRPLQIILTVLRRTNSFPGPSFSRASKPYSRATTVFVDEFDTGGLQGPTNRQVIRGCERRPCLCDFCPADRIGAQSGCRCEICCAPP